MLSKSFLIFILVHSFVASQAQISGIVSIPGDYSTVESLIAAINANGVTSPGLTINIAAGHQETLSNDSAGWIKTISSNINAPIVFQKTGLGDNPQIIAPLGKGDKDAILMLIGCDYITFDGLDLIDPLIHQNDTSRMEWGFALLKPNGFDGCNFITIKNCRITLQKANVKSIGIYANNHSPYSLTDPYPWDAGIAGGHYKIDNNVVLHAYQGIFINGYPQTVNFYDKDSEIGLEGGNKILDFGGGTLDCNGIYIANQTRLNVSNNIVTGGSGSTGMVLGIRIANAQLGYLNVDNNDISINSDGPTMICTGILYEASDWEYYDINIRNNRVHHCHCLGLFVGIQNYSDKSNVFIKNNMVDNVVSRGGFVGIGSGSSTITHVISNTIKQDSVLQQCYQFSGFILGSSGQLLIDSNNVYDLHSIGFTSIIGIETSNDSDVTDSVVIRNNNLFNFTISGTPYTGGRIIGIDFSSNSIAHNDIYGNDIFQFTIDDGSGGEIHGIHSSYGPGVYENIYKNRIHSLQINSQGGGIVNGFTNFGATLINFYQNSVYDLTSFGTSATVSGISNEFGTANIYNNFISQLEAPGSNQPSAIKGMKLTARSSCYFNTIYINASSAIGPNFGTAGIYALTNVNIDLKNNIVVNTSKSGSNGECVAYRRGAADLSMFDTTSNHNCFYAGIPGPNRLILRAGNNAMQTMADYKAFVYPREQNSVTELPPFKNNSSIPQNLHIKRYFPSLCESGGISVNLPFLIQTDFDNQSRFPASGVPFNNNFPPTAPDIGADEFAGNDLDISPPTLTFTPLQSIISLTPRTLIVTISDSTGVPTLSPAIPHLYWKINNGIWDTCPCVFVSPGNCSFTFGNNVAPGDSVFYYIVAQDSAVPVANVGSVPAAGAGGFTLNPPACSIPPVKPLFYTIITGIYGRISYANVNHTSLANVIIYMYNNGNQLIDSTKSDVNGFYNFSNPVVDQYTLGFKYNHVAGGYSALDAFLVMKHFAGIQLLQGLATKAADVNASSSITSADAMLIAKKYVKLISSFPANDWVYPIITINYTGTRQEINAELLCTGDVNGSYNP